jgi:hypothetical protein
MPCLQVPSKQEDSHNYGVVVFHDSIYSLDGLLDIADNWIALSLASTGYSRMINQEGCAMKL